MSIAQAYLADIEKLAGEKSSSKRRKLLTAVTDIFLVTEETQSASDSEMFGDVMERIAYELEVEARAQMAQRICDSQKLSRRFVVRLANDDIAVAGPVLERSKVLKDEDLVDIIRNRSEDHRHSIAGRETISQNVSGELVEHGGDQTITRVTSNEGATFSEEAMRRIARRAQENAKLREALQARKDVPPEIMEAAKTKVMERMRSEAQSPDSKFDESMLGAMVSKCADEIELECCQETVLKIERQHADGQLGEETIAKLASKKQIAEIVHCLTLMTGLDNWAISQCLLKAELPALAILCKANNFNRATFLALSECRMGDGGFKSATLAKAMRDYDNMTRATAQRIMRFLMVRLKLQKDNNNQA